jgi:exopolyphosphatase/guanosine-5'-triphosphate,3'-diphosphate pyrophosphatase
VARKDGIAGQGNEDRDHQGRVEFAPAAARQPQRGCRIRPREDPDRSADGGDGEHAGVRESEDGGRTGGGANERRRQGRAGQQGAGREHSAAAGERRAPGSGVGTPIEIVVGEVRHEVKGAHHGLARGIAARRDRRAGVRRDGNAQRRAGETAGQEFGARQAHERRHLTHPPPLGGTSASSLVTAGMLFGAIDVGTNSIHLVVVECDSLYDTSRVVYKAREMVRLGSNDALERGRLSAKAMARGVEAITRFVVAAQQRDAERIRAVATSAVREADNGIEFRALVEAQAGIALEILDATEEARLIHLGVASGFSIDDRTACIIDIGGGSTEFIVADGERPYLLDSVKLGSLRLYDAFLRDALDPSRAARGLNLYIRDALAPLMERVRLYRVDIAIGTSGTIMGLAAVDAAERGIVLRRVHGYSLTRARLEALQRRMLALTEAERRKIPGMNPRRADIIVAGNAVLIGALAQLGIDEIVVCERALRDGIIVDLIARDRALAQRLGDKHAARLEVLDTLGHKFGYLGPHERHVARLALRLFERLADVHALAPGDRDVLYAAALLHSIGRFIGQSGHHKHAAYIIRAAELTGWRDDERDRIALVARYYRKAMPKPTHPEFAGLAPAERERVAKLAALLRIADGLDARHAGTVNDIVVRRESGRIVIAAQAEADISGELAAAMLKADLFEHVFHVRVALEALTAEVRA